MLPICFGEATKLSAVLLDSDKQYEALVQLGVQTTTGDAEGEAIARSDPSQLSEQGLRAAMQGFIGPQQQVPPMHSALKRDGRPLYELEIGRASCRESVCPYVEISVVAGPLKKKQTNSKEQTNEK